MSFRLFDKLRESKLPQTQISWFQFIKQIILYFK